MSSDKDTQTLIAERIKEILEKKSWSQAELARRASLPKSFVSKIVTGNANLTLSTISSLENALDEKIITILTDEGE